MYDLLLIFVEWAGWSSIAARETSIYFLVALSRYDDGKMFKTV